MRHGWLVLSGTATAPDGHQDAIYYELTGDENRRWGQIAATFNGRDGQGRVVSARRRRGIARPGDAALTLSPG